MLYISNAFSLNMVADMIGDGIEINIKPLTIGEVKKILSANKFRSIVGHEDTANILTNLLDIRIDFNRATVKMEKGDILIVAQYIGPRLEQGATKLPEGAEIQFYMIGF